MRGKPAGAEVTLTLAARNWPGGLPIEGEFMETEAGSGYLVVSHRGDRFACVKVDPASIPSDAVVHPMFWVSRGRR